jgi:hypothetical protein
MSVLPSWAAIDGTGGDPHPELGAITLPADHFAPIPVRWRHVRSRDVLLVDVDDGPPECWSIGSVAEWRGVWRVTATCGTQRHGADVDPDEVVWVLVPAAERAAFVAARSALGAELLDRPE